MAKFDIINAAGHGYSQVWAERHYLMRLAFIPICLKFAALVTIFALGVEDQQIRMTLVMLPAYFAEGWMAAHFTRLVYFGQRWPFTPTGDARKDDANLMDRARGILSATVIYVLIQMVMAGIMAGMLAAQMDEIDPDRMDMKMGAILLFVFTLWAFRFMWLYIPAAANLDLADFTRRLGGFGVSFYMIGVWLVCFVPGMVLMMGGTFPVIFDDSGQAGIWLKLCGLVVQSALEAIVVLLVTGAMAYGIREIYQNHDGGKPEKDEREE